MKYCILDQKMFFSADSVDNWQLLDSNIPFIIVTWKFANFTLGINFVKCLWSVVLNTLKVVILYLVFSFIDRKVERERKKGFCLRGGLEKMGHNYNTPLIIERFGK